MENKNLIVLWLAALTALTIAIGGFAVYNSMKSEPVKNAAPVINPPSKTEPAAEIAALNAKFAAVEDNLASLRARIAALQSNASADNAAAEIQKLRNEIEPLFSALKDGKKDPGEQSKAGGSFQPRIHAILNDKITEDVKKLLFIDAVQLDALNAILEDEYRRYQDLLDENSESKLTEAGIVVVTTKPFKERGAEVENRLWKRFGEVMDEQKIENARTLFKKDIDQKFYGFGNCAITVALRKTGDVFSIETCLKSDGGSNMYCTSRTELPERYQKFWDRHH